MPVKFPEPIWIKQIYDYKVEWHEIPRLHAPYFRMPESTRLGGLHTTEGSTVESAINALEHGLKAGTPPDPCHLICGENRIIQTRPIGVQAASMRDPANRRLTVQIENVGFSKTSGWSLIDSTRKPLIATLAYCAEHFDIPLTVPLDFPDDCSDMKGEIWAKFSNSRRNKMQKIWDTATGWILHLEAPWNHHWDCGAMDRTQVLKVAADMLAKQASPAIVADSTGGASGEVV